MNPYTKSEHAKIEAVAFLALQHVNGVGYWKLRRLKESGINFYECFSSNSDEEKRKIIMEILNIDLFNDNNYRQELLKNGLQKARELDASKIYIIFHKNPYFPQSLLKLEDPPYWLFVQGDIERLNSNIVGIVGSRKADAEGLFLSRCITALLSENNYSTVSGLAEGIDSEVHYSSLEYDIPTIAVLGTGIDTNYPAGSEGLRKRIISSGGVIITEYLLNQKYSRENFVRRNRIQAALSNVLCPTQWKIRSGTAHTVNYAIKYRVPIIMPYTRYIWTEEAEKISDYEYGQLIRLPHESQIFINIINDIDEHSRPKNKVRKNIQTSLFDDDTEKNH